MKIKGFWRRRTSAPPPDIGIPLASVLLPGEQVSFTVDPDTGELDNIKKGPIEYP